MKSFALAAALLISAPATAQMPLRLTEQAQTESEALGLDVAMTAPLRSNRSWMCFGKDLATLNGLPSTITPVLPDHSKASDAAVMMLPSGDIILLSIGEKGWLGDYGIAAVVLKYWLNPVSADTLAT